ncbi:unnamed protein product, partial [Mesorhabditis belari]|uniref:E3 ubiquitin-protein ligase RNF182 n=1 Tax=Mesorhabditis belari TaxID=2138241 RepID=A0AAF3FJA9_9BILA
MRTPKSFRIFKSLNCESCEQAFSSSLDDLKSPRNLNCGLSVCKDCYETETLPKKHPHYKKHRCRAECFNNFNPAHFIIDILSSKHVILAPDGSGYILSDEFEEPKCSLCHEKYILNDRKPSVLFCNHLLCYRCLKERWIPTANIKFPHSIVCPQCKELTFYDDVNHGQAIDFLRELPAMREQMNRLKAATQFECKDCERMAKIDEIFTCTDCNYQTFPKIDCTVCQEEFLPEDLKPIQLYCNHAVCFRCIQHIRTPTADRKFPHKIICPICRIDAFYDNDHSSPYYGNVVARAEFGITKIMIYEILLKKKWIFD